MAVIGNTAVGQTSIRNQDQFVINGKQLGVKMVISFTVPSSDEALSNI